MAETLWVQGTVICRESGDVGRERAAKYVIVVPERWPESAVMTFENGYYRIGIKCQALVDKTLTLHYLGVSDTIGTKSRSVWGEGIKRVGDRLVFQFPTLVADAECEAFERDYATVRDHLEDIRGAPPDTQHFVADEPPRYNQSSHALGFTGVLLAFLGFLIEGVNTHQDACAPYPPDPTLGPTWSDGSAEQFTLFTILAAESRNLGFNLAPTRDIGEAVFWNPSALPGHPCTSLTGTAGFNGFYRASVAIPIGGRLGLGLGIASYNRFGNAPGAIDSCDLCPYCRRVGERAEFAAVAVRVYESISLGVSYKRLVGDMSVRVSEGEKMSLEHRASGFDLSMTMRITPSISFGAALTNLGGNYSGENGPAGQQSECRYLCRLRRTAGAGISYKRKHIHLGVDAHAGEGRYRDLGAGLDIRVSDHLRVNLGAGSRYATFMWGVEYRFLQYAFNTNDVTGPSYLVGFNLGF
jgi:hypothetical protein